MVDEASVGRTAVHLRTFIAIALSTMTVGHGHCSISLHSAPSGTSLPCYGPSFLKGWLIVLPAVVLVLLPLVWDAAGARRNGPHGSEEMSR